MRRVLILCFDGSLSLDVFGPLEVLRAAGGYDIALVSPGAGSATLSNGVGVATAPLPGDSGALDMLLVAGGEGTRAAVSDERIVAFVRRVAPQARRVVSVCTGAFLLAAAGLLDGRRATTHWAWCDALQRAAPRARVEHDPIFVRDGEVWTSAGVTAGMDLALALVEEDLGRERALHVARQLVVYLKRPGGQAQFSAGLAAQAAGDDGLRSVVGWIGEHLDSELTVARLARRAHMSERSFARAFRRELGVTPAVYVEQARVERARVLLEENAALGLDAVARAVGLSSAELLRRAFHRRLGVNPAAYRQRFRSAA